MAWEPWRVSDGLWERVLITPARCRITLSLSRADERINDRQCLEGILFVLFSGLPWEAVPTELRVGSQGGGSRNAVERGQAETA